MRWATVIPLCALLAGCAGKMIESGMNPMIGKPLSAATEKLGLPTEEGVIAGQKVYTWFTGRMIEGSSESCRIRAIMRNDLIASFDYEGNGNACLRYAQMLRR